MATVLIGPFTTTSAVSVTGNMAVSGSARIAGSTTINGDLIVGAGLIYNGATLSVGGVTLSGNINVVGLHGIDVSADPVTNIFTISGGGGGSGGGWVGTATTNLDMNGFSIYDGSVGYVTISGDISASVIQNLCSLNFQNQSTITNLSELNFQSFSGGGGTINSLRVISNGVAPWTFYSGFPTSSQILTISGSPSGGVDDYSGSINNRSTTQNTIGGITLANGGIATYTSSAVISNGNYNDFFGIGGPAGLYSVAVGNNSTYASAQPFACAGMAHIWWSNQQIYADSFIQLGVSTNVNVELYQSGPGNPIYLRVSNTLAPTGSATIYASMTLISPIPT